LPHAVVWSVRLQATSAELREAAAEGLGELLELTSEEALKPFVVQITGPLIRIIGDRFTWQVWRCALWSAKVIPEERKLLDAIRRNEFNFLIRAAQEPWTISWEFCGGCSQTAHLLFFPFLCIV
jgi:hypothetical protein